MFIFIRLIKKKCSLPFLHYPREKLSRLVWCMKHIKNLISKWSSLDLKMGLYYFQSDCSDTEDLSASCLEKFHSLFIKKNPNQIIKSQTNKKEEKKNKTKPTKPKTKQTSKNKNKPSNKPKSPLSILILKLLNLETDASNEFSSSSSFPSAQALHN